MKKLLMVAMAVFACVAGAGVLDRVTMSRYQAKLNERHLVGRETVVIGGVTNIVTMYRQSGVEWAVTNAPKVFRGTLAVIRYSKLKLIVAAKAAGKWADVKAFIQKADIEDEWNACQYITSDYPAYIAATNSVVSLGVATDAEVKAFMKAAED